MHLSIVFRTKLSRAKKKKEKKKEAIEFPVGPDRQTFSSCSTVGVSIPGGLTPVFYPPVRRDQRPASALAGQASGGVPSGVPSGVPAAVPAAVPTTVYWREPGFMIHGILRFSLWPDLLYKFISSHSPATISFYIHSYFTVVLVLVRKDISPGSVILRSSIFLLPEFGYFVLWYDLA